MAQKKWNSSGGVAMARHQFFIFIALLVFIIFQIGVVSGMFMIQTTKLIDAYAENPISREWHRSCEYDIYKSNVILEDCSTPNIYK